MKKLMLALAVAIGSHALAADFFAPTDGKVKVRITPKDENADSFFVRALLKD